MTICKITVFALVRELQALQRYDVWASNPDCGCCGPETYEDASADGQYIRAEDFLAVMARNVIPEGSTP